MYRLVKFSGVSVSRPRTISYSLPIRSCSLCGNRNNTIFYNLKRGTNVAKPSISLARHQSTGTDFVLKNEISKRRRFKKDKKYFTELLEIYSNTSNQTKASVRNLKPRDVSRIADNPTIELDHFHKIKSGKVAVTKEPKDSHSEKRNNYETNLKKLQDVSEIAVNSTNESNKFHKIESRKTCRKEPTYSSNNKENYEKNDKSFLDVNKTPVSDFSDVSSSEERFFSSKSKLDDDIMKHVSKTTNELFDHDKAEELEEKLQDHLGSLEDVKNPDELSSDLQIQEHIEDELDFENNIDDIDRQSTSKTHERRKLMPHKLMKEKLKENFNQLEKQCREKAFNTTLLTYLNLCVSCNYLNRGLATLHYYKYRSKMSKRNPTITDIRIFEVLARGFAAKGNYSKIHDLWSMMLSLGLQPSLNMYVLRLECAARSQNMNSHVSEIINAMKRKGHQLNDIFVKFNFLGDQRNVILKAIQEVEPSFKPIVPPPSICYSCSLLQEINDNQGKNSNLNSPAEKLLNKEQMKKFAEQQFNNEFLFQMKVKSIEKRIISEDNLKFYREKLETMRELWMQDLRKGFERDIAILDLNKKSRHNVSLLPYLKVLPRDCYVDIMMNEIQRLAEGSETFSPSLYLLFRNLGAQVKNRYVYKFKKANGIIEKTKLIYDKYLDWYLDPKRNKCRSSNGRQEWQLLVHEHQDGPTITIENDVWPAPVLLGIGKFLYNIIIGDVNIDVNILNKTNKQHMLPAFYRVYRRQGVKSIEEIKPHPVISKLFRAASEDHILFDITQVPMLSPPVPWSTHSFGGYLTLKTDIVRLPDQAQLQKQRLREAPPQQLYPSLDSLNQLGSIPWRVNLPVLDTVIEVFNNGGSAKLEIPEPPYLSPVPDPITPSMGKQERYEAFRNRMLLRRQKAEMYSLWCDALYKLSLANHFRDKIFWLPHNMDFRGRVYPVPPHLNHLGADMSRSLLCFALGKPLGPDGLDWLKIHLVNLLGTKKRSSVRERLEYAETILPEVLDSAEKPLTGLKWWMDSETPWQTLACCLEIAAALKHPGGPENFVSHFPIHQDGSCNGLQHYAALGRDEAGACSVNLMPQEMPQDVYSCVAALVERERAKDAAAGMDVAKQLDGFVRRKVIKQTVMTTVYGVTRFGARLQIAKQLKDIGAFPKEYVWPASSYLVAKTFESLREMFNSTKEIQDWFTECARLVSQICGQKMEYVTPLGLPVVQYYTRHTRNIDSSMIKLGHLQEYFPIDMFERPNVMKQKNAFPPNFIHSLDSSHMMLTSIFSEQRGITFVSVHDCYWTHASTVHIMNQICREQFVALHSQPILEDLSKFMLAKYGFEKIEKMDSNHAISQVKQRLNQVLAQVPPKGTFILENVLDSVYFFS